MFESEPQACMYVELSINIIQATCFFSVLLSCLILKILKYLQNFTYGT